MNRRAWIVALAQCWTRQDATDGCSGGEIEECADRRKATRNCRLSIDWLAAPIAAARLSGRSSIPVLSPLDAIRSSIDRRPPHDHPVDAASRPPGWSGRSPETEPGSLCCCPRRSGSARIADLGVDPPISRLMQGKTEHFKLHRMKSLPVL
ncbi:hypothetical protein Y032_0227g2827 [Ancylostoma ceylanicum]|uniref:Uncharacterized protein n=1 Tax=Ancylostoma ceylanicum TaxID=53326 RepID=A0A016SHI7_9BILA|nr:hypothetical protein Y032_0227g2827 [Ancylostoma ceylanicum]